MSWRRSSTDGSEGRRIDLRLAVGAAAAWIAAVLCLTTRPGVALVVGVVSAAAAVAALMIRAHVRMGAFVAVVGFCVAIVVLPLSARLWQARASPVAQWAAEGASVTAQIQVSGDPRLLAARGPAGAPRTVVDGVLLAVSVRGHRVGTKARILVLGPAAAWHDVLPGQRVQLDGTLQPPLGDDLLTAVLVAHSDPVLLGRPPWYQRMANHVRTALREAAAGLPSGPRGLLPGLVDGDTSGLDPVLAERFRVAGLTHLVAVSGTNCAIVVGASLLVLRRFGCRPQVCAVVGAAVLVMFVVVARPTPSVLRAAVMSAIALVALSSGRRGDGVPMVAAAVLGLLLWRPQLATDIGFAMSVLATVALLTVAPTWAIALRRRRVPPVLAEAVAVAAAAHVVTAPLVAVISGTVSLVAVPANLLAEPVVPVATILGFAAALAAAVVPAVGAVLAEVAGWPCRWLAWDAEFFGALNGARLPWPGGVTGGALLAVATVLLVWLCRRRSTRRMLLATVVVVTAIQIPFRTIVSSWPPPGWIFVACDVGQGDGLVLPAGPNAAVVVDAGPDPVAIDRCLHDLHVTSVPLVVLTHFHLDHVAGLSGVFHGRAVGRVVTGPLPEPASGLAIVTTLLRAHHLVGAEVAVGQRFDIGSVRLDVLGPATIYRGTRSDPNNSSAVLRATVRGRRILLSADAEIEAQQALLAAGTDLRADVLKVPHHGSAYSDPRFLAAVDARVAVISVGRHNDYGHPSPLLLATLRRLDLPVYRTDQDGDVAVAEVGGELRAVTRAHAVAIGSEAVGDAHGQARRSVASVARVTMGTWLWPVDDLRPRTRPTQDTSRVSCCSSAMRNCSSVAPSSRSPPPCLRPIRRPTCKTEPVANSTPAR